MVTDGRMDGTTDGPTDKASYRVACPQLISVKKKELREKKLQKIERILEQKGVQNRKMKEFKTEKNIA